MYLTGPISVILTRGRCVPHRYSKETRAMPGVVASRYAYQFDLVYLPCCPGSLVSGGNSESTVEAVVRFEPFCFVFLYKCLEMHSQ
jgi:hypothetical protein